MKTFSPLLGFLLTIVIVFSCQKEKSFEEGNLVKSAGSLQSGTTGDCLGNAIGGTYKKDTVLTDSNYVDIKVDVTATGSYVVSSDTLNGIWFHAQGSFTTKGVTTVRLLGNGTPASSGINVFTVTYDTTQCTFSISTVDGGSGGTSILTLAGSPNACTGASVQGILTAGVQTNNTNTATIQVNVTSAGTYAISTPAVNGTTFTASGTFTATGPQSIDLVASGTPVAAGTYSIPISVGTSSCSFQITVVGGTPAVYTLNGAPNACTGAAVQGPFVIGTALSTNNTATVQVNVTTAGTYSIITTPVDGITFTGSGTFSSTGVQAVVLIGSGTPTAIGSFTIPISAGGTNCSFSLTVSPIDYFPRVTNDNWSYDLLDNSGTVQDSLLINAIAATHNSLGNTYNIFLETSDASAGFDSSGYYRKSGNSYYQYFNLSNFFVADATPAVWGENLFLKDNGNVGDTWSTQFTVKYSDTLTNVRIRETIQQQDVPITVNGIVYQNTIVVREDYEYYDGTEWTAVFTDSPYSLYYYSRNIGLIDLEIVSDLGTQYSQRINRYQVQ